MTTASRAEPPPTDAQARGTRGTDRVIVRGALAGAAATLAFLIVHAIVISDIWFSAPIMLAAGSACGASIAASYVRAPRQPTVGRWFLWNAYWLSLLGAIGAVSTFLYVPRWSMAELLVGNPPVGDLFVAAVPLMAVFTPVGGLLGARLFGMDRSALPSAMVTSTLLVVLLGHNVAIVGMVSIPAGSMYLIAEMYGLFAFLGLSYTISAAPFVTRGTRS